jgi:uncharacterized protein
MVALAGLNWLTLQTAAASGSDLAHSPDASPKEIEAAATPKPEKSNEGETEYWQALRLLAGTSPTDVAAGRNALQKSSDLEFTHAQILLGNCLMGGAYGFPKDINKGAALFRLAAERGNAFAKVSLGQCYFTGTGGPRDRAKAAEWLTAALAPDADYSRPVPPADFLAARSLANPTGQGETVAGQLDRDPVSESRATAHFLLGQIATQESKLEEAQAHYVAAAVAGPNGREGIYQAALDAALNYAFGNGVPRDLAKANDMLDQSRKLGARVGVNLIHNYAMLKIVDEFATGDLEETVNKAADTFETDLQLKIASTFADKKSKQYNPAEAVKWYELAAEGGRPWAMLSLAFIYVRGDLGKPDNAKAVYWFEQAGDGEKPKHGLAAANLGIAYENGLGIAPDHSKAAEIFVRSRASDFICYLGSIGKAPATFQTYEQDLQLNEDWANGRDDSEAQRMLGVRYTKGWGVPIDLKEAAKWMKKAAKNNNGAAMCDLGYLYEQNQKALGVTMDDAADWYRKGSERGNIHAILDYANCLYRGRGESVDRRKAKSLYEEALRIDPGSSRANNELGIAYEDDLIEAVMAKNERRANDCREKMMGYYLKAAQAGQPYAEYNLARLYLSSLHRTEDLASAKDDHLAYLYFEAAADHGDEVAHLYLGEMHEMGLGVPITYSEAAYHYRIAALDGNTDALSRLVKLYLTGELGEVDLGRAAFWLNQMYRRGQISSLIPLADVLIKSGQYENAIKLLDQLADMNVPIIAGYACERLSRVYEDGTGVAADPRKARKYFDRAVRLGNDDAITRLALRQMKEKNIKEAIANFDRAALTSAEARYYLGQLYYVGKDVPKDDVKAVQYMRSAATDYNLPALYFLAVLAFNRAPNAPSLDEAIRFAQQAENGGLKQATKVRELLEKRRDEAGDVPEAGPKPSA